MRRSVITTLVTVSLTVLGLAASSACAEAPYDDNLSGLTQEQKPTEPGPTDNSSKLAPPSNPTKEQPAADAGTDTGSTSSSTSSSGSTSSSSGSTSSSSGSTSSSSGSTSSSSGSTSSSSGSSGSTGADCPNDPSYYLKFIMASNPTPCPCAATECCYLGLGCIAK